MAEWQPCDPYSYPAWYDPYCHPPYYNTTKPGKINEENHPTDDENLPARGSHDLADSHGSSIVIDDEEEEDEPCTKRFTYCLKIFNPDKRSQFSVEKLRRSGRFKSPKELRECLLEEYGNLICANNDDFQVGFTKGKRGGGKVWITDVEDLNQLYSVHGEDVEIILWCEGQSLTSSKRRKDVQDGSKPKRQAIQDEVNDIFIELQEKHGSEYTPAQCRLWANMIQLGTHKDYNNPPHVPMFGMTSKERSTTKSTATGLSEALSGIAEGFVRACKTPACSQPQRSCSPTSTTNEEIKSSTLRSNYIEQLKELYHLFEATAITKEEYEEQKLTLLSKMKAL